MTALFPVRQSLSLVELNKAVFLSGAQRSRRIRGCSCNFRIGGDTPPMGANEKIADMKHRQIGLFARLTVAVLCIVNAAQSSSQQPKTGQISGHIVDVVGATIKGASVFIRRNIPPEEIMRLLTHTDIHGDFKLVLPEGGYDVLVTSPGFAARVETVPVLAGRTRKTQWKLKPLDCSFPGVNCDTVQ
jgi:hypothetical protein